MKDVQVYRQAPQRILGKTKKEALKYLINNDCLPFGIARENGKNMILPEIVQITLNIDKEMVIGTKLESRIFGVW
jgi:hypothetical protein